MADVKMSLAGKRVVVIGGTSGLGFAVALLARDLGAALVVASSKAASVDAAVERLPGATGDVVDLQEGASIAGFLERLGPFDHLAITAGDVDNRERTLTELITSRSGSAGRIATATSGLPLPRAASPAEAAMAYVYLMLNGYVTGQVLPVDGGGLLV